MKGKSLITCLVFYLFTAFSCKKEAMPTLVGDWINTSVYTESSGWQEVSLRGIERISFDANTKFSIFSDIPGGFGTYTYSRPTSELQLQFEADYFNPARTHLSRVETLTNDKLVLEYSSQANGVVYKTKKVYSRLVN